MLTWLHSLLRTNVHFWSSCSRTLVFYALLCVHRSLDRTPWTTPALIIRCNRIYFVMFTAAVKLYNYFNRVHLTQELIKRSTADFCMAAIFFVVLSYINNEIFFILQGIRTLCYLLFYLIRQCSYVNVLASGLNWRWPSTFDINLINMFHIKSVKSTVTLLTTFGNLKCMYRPLGVRTH